ncbi:hypothetical protein DK419_04060 [Methylobacterium terrae]|uniref:Uncharacterized protein n=1 Tax=Methylobacterium terrae TaxID=2202827 RepID=A0A2U8WJ71_9HYPH|nr:hypothetical protein [Methylobacterium terrae]AWN45598.1 hypothetical protein DK419_04060 [Methylobacterium terrae]
MPEPTAPASIARPHDLTPSPSIAPDPDLRAIDLAPSAGAGSDRLDEGARAHLARAGRDALDACLRRFAPEERAAFWRAIGRCYNRPYNSAAPAPPDAAPVEEAGPDLASAATAIPDAVPAAHVIEAVCPNPDVPLPQAGLP